MMTGGDATSFSPHWALYPKTYFVHPAPFPLIDLIDGDLSKSVWNDVPWSEPWQDIQGKDAPGRGGASNDSAFQPALTRFKALYDDTHVYIGALLDSSSDFNTHAEFTQRNDPIFQKDSDFEVFVDVFGNNHNYKELEVNAINTIWNLLLDRPYSEGGTEHSGRVARPGEAQFYEVYHQKTATRVVSGQLNDPTGVGAQWSIEVALSYQDLGATTTTRTTTTTTTTPPLAKENEVSLLLSSSGITPTTLLRPTSGTFWRVNFSRVELQGRVNWTWQPQVVWNPGTRTHQGQINMHLPDAWGYFLFLPKNNNGATTTTTARTDTTTAEDQEQPHEVQQQLLLQRFRDPSWPLRITTMNVFYAQQYFYEQSGRYASDWSQLQALVDPALVQPFFIELETTPNRGGGYVATVRAKPHTKNAASATAVGDFATIDHTRLLNVVVERRMEERIKEQVQEQQ
ncbi:hypothetical protein ACA910_021556 [Epithemia clementina (nom. ined.)]